MYFKSLSYIVHVIPGISTAVPFQEGIHPPSHRFFNKCEDIFKPFAKKGQIVIPNQTTWNHTFTAPSINETKVTVEVYKTSKDPPPMTTDDCIKVSELYLNLSPVQRLEKPFIDVTMHLGNTTISITAAEHGTDQPVTVEFDFLH